MNLILIALLALAPQEDENRRFRESALGLPGVEVKAPAPRAGDTPAPAPAPAQAPTPTATFMALRTKRASEDYKALLDHNVFSPPRKKDSSGSKGPSEGTKPPEGPKVRNWVVTGIVYNAVDKRYEVLLEEGKESKFVKTGDAVAGVTIGEVTLDQVTILKAGTPSVLKLNDKIAETVAGGSAPSAPPTPEEQAEVDKVRDKLKKRHRRESVPDEAEEDAGGGKKPK